jgi:hypothetical protein
LPRCARAEPARSSGAMDRVRSDVPDDRAGLIQIELRLDGSLPVGVATGPGGTARDFTGWVGLMSAVDALVPGDEDNFTEED